MVGFSVDCRHRKPSREQRGPGAIAVRLGFSRLSVTLIGTVIMGFGADALASARTRAFSMPLADLNPGDPELFRTDTHWPYFERLRANPD